MRRIAVFVDAGYLWVQLSHIVHGSITGRDKVSINYPMMREGMISQVSAHFPGVNLLRIYWYDGPGPHGKTPGHNAIEDLDDVKLRLGTRNGVGDQKAVDGLIIADIIALAQSRAISDALLISGDADLTPGVSAAQGLGIRVHLLTMGPPNATSPFLRSEVDCKTHWDEVEIKKFVSSAVPNVPQQQVQPQTQSVSTSAQAATVGTAWMDDAVAAVIDKVDAGKLATLAKGTVIPKDIDVLLLREGCGKANLKTLEETQKRQLRNRFRNKIKSHTP